MDLHEYSKRARLHELADRVRDHIELRTNPADAAYRGTWVGALQRIAANENDCGIFATELGDVLDEVRRAYPLPEEER